MVELYLKYDKGNFTPPPINLTDINDRLYIVGNGMGQSYVRTSINAKTDQDRNILFITIKDCKFEGNINLADCAYLNFENVWFENCKIEFNGVWDSKISNCHFVKSSFVIKDRPGKCKNLVGGSQSNCITISDCRFEISNNEGSPLLEARNSRKLFIKGNKFHGNLPTPLAVPHLYMNGVHDCLVKDNNFTTCKTNYIQITNCQRIKFDNIYDGKNRFTTYNCVDIITN